MDLYYLLIIVATLVGFSALAWLLLAPIWRFLDREEQISEEWTKEALARRRRRQQHAHDESAGTKGPLPRNTGGEDDASPLSSGDGATTSRDG